MQELKKNNQVVKKHSSLRVVFKQRSVNSEYELAVSPYSYFFKHLFDFSLAMVSLILLSPILITLYLITKHSSVGPGFYHQKRIGLNGEEFHIFKFRSMKVDSEDDIPMLTNNNDNRITPWGRFMRKYYLDELPQLLNVIRGDMSIVGPRPERKYFIDKIKEKNGDFDSLLQVKPGITSLGQIRFGYAHSVDQMLQRLKYEQLYLKRVSFWTDIKIIFNTFGSVAKAKGK